MLSFADSINNPTHFTVNAYVQWTATLDTITVAMVGIIRLLGRKSRSSFNEEREHGVSGSLSKPRGFPLFFFFFFCCVLFLLISRSDTYTTYLSYEECLLYERTGITGRENSAEEIEERETRISCDSIDTLRVTIVCNITLATRDEFRARSMNYFYRHLQFLFPAELFVSDFSLV